MSAKKTSQNRGISAANEVDVPRFVRRLVEARESLRWNQSDLANATGLDPAAICNYEGGRRLPNAVCLVRLARALRVSIDWLLGLENARIPHQIEVDGVRYLPSPNSKTHPPEGME